MKNQVLLGDYALHKDGYLGKGSFASVFKGHRISDNLPVAIKVVKTSKLEQQYKKNLDDEVAILRRMNHENILKLYDVYERKSKKETEMCLMTELCEGTLEEVINENSPVNEEVFKSYLRDIIEAIKYLNANNLVHRDLKPANILLSKTKLKLADFGFVKYLPNEELTKTWCGSPLYMAPEVLTSKKYDSKVDLWSVGIILYELVAGYRPYKATSLEELTKIVVSKPLEYPKGIFSPSLVTLISGLLQINPKERFSIEDVLENEYVKTHCSNKLMETYRQQDLENVEETYSIVFIEEALDIKSLNGLLFHEKDPEIHYPKVIFDFSNLTCNQEELVIIETIEENLKMSWVIAELALIKSKINQPLESLSLFLRSIQILHTCYISIKGNYESKRISAIKYWIQQRFEEFLGYSNEVKKFIQGDKNVSIEKLLFDYALEMIKEASFDELMDHSSKNYLILFERSLIVINYLNSLKLNLNDQQMLKKYSVSIKNVLDHSRNNSP